MILENNSFLFAMKTNSATAIIKEFSTYNINITKWVSIVARSTL